MSVTTDRTEVPSSRKTPQIVRPIPRKRPNNPNFRLVDGLWMASFALISNLLLFFNRTHLASTEVMPAAFGFIGQRLHVNIVTSIIGVSYTLIGPAVYAALLKSRDRSAACIAGALCATSIYLVQASHLAPSAGLVALLVAGALAAANFDSVVFAAVLLAVATIIRPEAALFAVAIYGCFLIRRTKYVLYGGVIYVGLIEACFVQPEFRHHQNLNLMLSRAHYPLLVSWALTPMFSSLWWFVFPFASEMTGAESRRKYAPLALSLALYLAFASLFVHPLSVQTLLPAVPLLYMMVGIGIARILPLIAGDIPSVAMRYLFAAAAVLSLVALTFTLQWRQLIRQTIISKPAIILSTGPIPATLPEQAAPFGPIDFITPAPAKAATILTLEPVQSKLSKVKK